MRNDEYQTKTSNQDTERDERLVDGAYEHLRLALETGDRQACRYHVRSALQALYIFREGDST